jgi:hypothetical protein
VLPSPRSLAAFGLRSALNDLAAAEDRAHAFLDAYETPPGKRAALAAALRALDKIDAGAHEFNAALRSLEAAAEADDPAVVTMTQKESPRSQVDQVESSVEA